MAKMGFLSILIEDLLAGMTHSIQQARQEQLHYTHRKILGHAEQQVDSVVF